MKQLKSRALLLSGILVLTLSSIGMSTASVAAATCSGKACNGTDPVRTGCNANAYLAKRYAIVDAKNGLAFWQLYADVYYSRTCATNWLRVSHNPFGGNTKKTIWAHNSNFTEVENDYGYGSSYSMQVYAPGSTPISAAVRQYDTAGNLRAYLTVQTLR